jgi:hypothetical protein
MSVYLCMVPLTWILNFAWFYWVIPRVLQLCLRLQLFIDSLPCFAILFQGYLPLQNNQNKIVKLPRIK